MQLWDELQKGSPYTSPGLNTSLHLLGLPPGPGHTGNPRGGSWECRGSGSLLPLSAPLPPMRLGSKWRVEDRPGCVTCVALLLGKRNNKGNGMSPPKPRFAGGKPVAVRTKPSLILFSENQTENERLP